MKKQLLSFTLAALLAAGTATPAAAACTTKWSGTTCSGSACAGSVYSGSFCAGTVLAKLFGNCTSSKTSTAALAAALGSCSGSDCSAALCNRLLNGLCGGTTCTSGGTASGSAGQQTSTTGSQTTTTQTTPAEDPTTTSESPATPSEDQTATSESPATPSEDQTTTTESPATPSEDQTTTTESPATPSEDQTTTSESPATPAQSQTASSIQAYEQEVVDLVNAERAKYGLSALTVREDLCSGARLKSQDMHDNNYFSHTSPTYGSPFDMMSTLGISYSSAGENIAMGYATPEAVMNGWMNSEGHRANILSSSYTAIGVGYVADGNYWTQWFVS